MTPENKPDPRLLSTSETAKMLGMSARKLWSLTNCRQISVVKIGSRNRYELTEIRRFIERHSVKATT